MKGTKQQILGLFHNSLLFLYQFLIFSPLFLSILLGLYIATTDEYATKGAWLKPGVAIKYNVSEKLLNDIVLFIVSVANCMLFK